MRSEPSGCRGSAARSDSRRGASATSGFPPASTPRCTGRRRPGRWEPPSARRGSSSWGIPRGGSSGASARTATSRPASSSRRTRISSIWHRGCSGRRDALCRLRRTRSGARSRVGSVASGSSTRRRPSAWPGRPGQAAATASRSALLGRSRRSGSRSCRRCSPTCSPRAATIRTRRSPRPSSSSASRSRRRSSRSTSRF